MNFQAALKQTYLQAPCQVLPNPLWKTLQGLEDCENRVDTAPDRTIRQLESWRKGNLLVSWQKDRASLRLRVEPLSTMEIALIHADLLEPFLRHPQLPAIDRQTPFFRLIHKLENLRPAELPPAYQFKTVDAAQECEAAARLICQCYESLKPEAATVKAWTQHPVFEPDLWVWVWDLDHDRPAGLGIAELDPAIGEGALEWIQILPDERGQGLGKQLVRELLARLKKRALFVTVSGEIENLSQPERLYRSCGFEGQDIWWMLRANRAAHPDRSC